MLIMSAIVFAGVCTLVLFFATLNHRHSQQMTAIRESVKADVNTIAADSQELDRELVTWLVEGKDTREAIQQWQRVGAEKVPSDKASRPWAWTEHDLKRWQKEQARSRCEQVKRKALFSAVAGMVGISLLFGGATMVSYSVYAKQQSTATEFDAGSWDDIPTIPHSGTSNQSQSSSTP